MTEFTREIDDPNNPGQRITVPMTREEVLAQRTGKYLSVNQPEFNVVADGADLEIAYIQLVNAVGEPIEEAISFVGVLNGGEDVHTLYTNAQGQNILPFVSIRPGRHIISSPDFPTTQVIINATAPSQPIDPADLAGLLDNPGFYVIGVRELAYELGVVPPESITNPNMRDMIALARGLLRRIAALEAQIQQLLSP